MSDKPTSRNMEHVMWAISLSILLSRWYPMPLAFALGCVVGSTLNEVRQHLDNFIWRGGLSYLKKKWRDIVADIRDWQAAWALLPLLIVESTLVAVIMSLVLFAGWYFVWDRTKDWSDD